MYLEIKLEKVELRTEDETSAYLTLPTASDNENCIQVATEVIRIKLQIASPIDVTVAAYMIRKEVIQDHDDRKLRIHFTNKQQKTDLTTAAKTAQSVKLFVSEYVTKEEFFFQISFQVPIRKTVYAMCGSILQARLLLEPVHFMRLCSGLCYLNSTLIH